MNKELKIQFYLVINILIFRRIRKGDSPLKFYTGFNPFDQLNPTGTLLPYIKEDVISGGKYWTYLFGEQIHKPFNLMGLLRYRYTTIEEFKHDFEEARVNKEIISEFLSEFESKKLKIIYLSRIGVSNQWQGLHIGPIISNFFEFLIKRKQEGVIIYAKLIEVAIEKIRLGYEILGENYDKKWGKYYLISKMHIPITK